jgi:hypothetical protein
METLVYPDVKRTVINDLSSFVQRVSPPPATPATPGFGSKTEFSTGVLLRIASYRRGNAFLYRGQSDSRWELSPKIDRPTFKHYRYIKSITRQSQEVSLLSEFMHLARSRLSITPENTWEWLALAQHHGLATRLLDWSANPLAAIFFAVSDESVKTESVVWEYRHTGVLSDLSADPFAIKEFVTISPTHISARITAQGGCFSVHPTPDILPVGNLEMFLIPQQSRDSIRMQLAGLGVTRATLFPDLDGIASYSNWMYSLTVPPATGGGVNYQGKVDLV